MIAIIDYGVGNLFSLLSSLEFIGAKAVITDDADVIGSADKLFLPGVGAFGDAMEKLKKSGLDKTLLAAADRGTDIMGICLGMQLLFEKSYEYGEHAGLGLLPGSVRPIAPVIGPGRKVPHIGWNVLSFPENKPKSPLFAQVDAGDIKNGDCVYFVHSYYAENCESSLIATCEYGRELTAAVAVGNVMGCQFHPEKSGDAGLEILKAFCEVEK